MQPPLHIYACTISLMYMYMSVYMTGFANKVPFQAKKFDPCFEL